MNYKTNIKKTHIYYMRFFYIILTFFILSCAQTKSVGPNYNQGRSHNQSTANRISIVNKETLRSVRQMIKARKKASKTLPKPKKSKRNHRMYI